MIPDPPRTSAGGAHLRGTSGDSKLEMFGRVQRSDEDADTKGRAQRCGLEKLPFPAVRAFMLV